MDHHQFHNEMNISYYRANCYHTTKNPDNDATSGNHHVINATYYLIKRKIDPDFDSYNTRIHQSLFIERTKTDTDGIYSRHPKKVKDAQTHDDYIGIVASSVAVDNIRYPTEIYDYGMNHNWYYPNLKESTFTQKWNYWHGRFPGTVGLYKRAAGVKTSLLDRVGYCAVILAEAYLNKNRNDTSGRILTWLSNSVMKGESRMVDYCIDLWEDKIKEQYPDGFMGEVLGIYHGFDHPFAKAMKGKI